MRKDSFVPRRQRWRIGRFLGGFLHKRKGKGGLIRPRSIERILPSTLEALNRIKQETESASAPDKCELPNDIHEDGKKLIMKSDELANSIHQDMKSDGCSQTVAQQGKGIDEPRTTKRLQKPPTSLRIYAVTWNMNGKIAQKSLPKLLDNGRGEYDFYVIGLQESPISAPIRILQPILGRQYSLVAKSAIGSLQLYVFGKSSLQPYISGKTVDKLKFPGLGGVIGRQKGAVAVSFSVCERSFLFISSHFAAHEKKLKERNVQYLQAREKIFTRPMNSCIGNAPVRSDSVDFVEQKNANGNSVDESDVVVWLGDFNYRIEGSRGLVKSFLKLNLQKLLWRRDQLFNGVDKGQIFNGFVEGPLTFKPTYKYDVGTDDYDTSEKERVPSWTDRILIKTNNELLNVSVDHYRAIETLRTSDHRPVKASLHIRNLK